MITNPLQSPLFVPTVIRVALILAALFAMALWRQWRKAAAGGHSTMLAKMMTVLWVAPILVIAVFCGGIILYSVVTLVLVVALTEYARIAGLQTVYKLVLIIYSLVAITAAGLGAEYIVLALLPFGLFLTATLVPILSGRVAGAPRQIGAILLGFLYISFGLSSIVVVRRSESWGLAFLIVVGTAVALSDAGGFVLGSRLRGPKLAPKVSPNKTWSGAFGSLLGAGAGIVIQWPAISDRWSATTILALLASTTVGSIWGDLVESTLKRDFGTKDAGTVLGAFGGVLDRFDSFLIAVPATYVVLLLILQHR